MNISGSLTSWERFGKSRLNIGIDHEYNSQNGDPWTADSVFYRLAVNTRVRTVVSSRDISSSNLATLDWTLILTTFDNWFQIEMAIYHLILLSGHACDNYSLMRVGLDEIYVYRNFRPDLAASSLGSETFSFSCQNCVVFCFLGEGGGDKLVLMRYCLIKS